MYFMTNLTQFQNIDNAPVLAKWLIKDVNSREITSDEAEIPYTVELQLLEHLLEQGNLF